MTAGIIIQARLSSSRLPGKVLLNLEGMTLLSRVITRMSATRLPIAVATSESSDDDLIEHEALSNAGVAVFRGSLNNVRNRLYSCAIENAFDVIIRVTADNPFSEPSFVNQALEKIENGAHYARADPSLCPDGSNIEAFRFAELKASEENDPTSLNAHDAEHVTPEIINRLKGSNLFSQFSPDPNLGDLDSDIHIGIDTLADYIKVSSIYQKLGEISGLEDDLLTRVVAIVKANPDLFKRGRRHELRD